MASSASTLLIRHARGHIHLRVVVCSVSTSFDPMTGLSGAPLGRSVGPQQKCRTRQKQKCRIFTPHDPPTNQLALSFHSIHR
eukprot:scaffold5100_cov110-Skeletonema_marinoi.AAC.3